MKETLYIHVYELSYEKNPPGYYCTYCDKIANEYKGSSISDDWRIGIISHKEMEKGIECEARKLAEALE